MHLCPNLSISDSHLEEITNKLYTLKKIILYSHTGLIEYELKDNGDVNVYSNNELNFVIKQVELFENKKKIYNAIKMLLLEMAHLR